MSTRGDARLYGVGVDRVGRTRREKCTERDNQYRNGRDGAHAQTVPEPFVKEHKAGDGPDYGNRGRQQRQGCVQRSELERTLHKHVAGDRGERKSGTEDCESQEPAVCERLERRSIEREASTGRDCQHRRGPTRIAVTARIHRSQHHTDPDNGKKTYPRHPVRSMRMIARSANHEQYGNPGHDRDRADDLAPMHATAPGERVETER